MEIPNLRDQATQNFTLQPPRLMILAAIIPAAIVIGFFLSRLLPTNLNPRSSSLSNGRKPIPVENIKSSQDLVVGNTYGNSEKTFKDIATGVIEKGNLNGEGTHILNREGGLTQRAALTSSVLDLDLFVGRKVEVKGETNVSNKTAWLLDVGSIKMLE